MKNLILYYLILLPALVFADTPPPGTVKAKTWTGDGNTSITATGTALDVNVVNSSGLTTVNQGNASLSQSWRVNVTNSSLPVTGTFWQSIQPVSGTLTCNAGSGTQAVSLASLPALSAGAATIGNVNINGTVPVSGLVAISGGTITATNSANADTGGAVPDQATQIGGVDGSGDLRAVKVSNLGVVSVDASGSTVPVSGTFWQATQPVSGTFWQATQPVSGTFWQATQPVSAATLPLPSGAATSAKQPAFGVAGTASSDVITVQGKAAMTPLLVDGSSSTQPVSGTVTADAGTGTFLVDGSGHTQPVSGTFWQATQPVSGTFWQATQPVSGTVTANIGTSGSLALNATVAALQVAQGSATSGQSGSLVQGAVTTAAPTYTTAQTAPLSLTTGGSVRVLENNSSNINSNISTVASEISNVTATPGSVPPGLAFYGASLVNSAAPSYADNRAEPLSLTIAGALRVDGSASTQPVSGTFWQATQPVSIATAPALVAGSAIIGKVGIDQTTPGTTNGVQVNAALPAGSNVIGHVIADSGSTTVVTGTVAVTESGTWTVQPGNTANTTAWLVNAVPKTPTATTVKAAAVTIGTTAVRLTNDGSAPPATRVLLIAQLLSTSTANCFLGPSGVTSSGATRGIQMFAGQSFSFNNDAGDYYAICDATSQTFYITEQE